jgi:hypothetical protein
MNKTQTQNIFYFEEWVKRSQKEIKQKDDIEGDSNHTNHVVTTRTSNLGSTGADFRFRTIPLPLCCFARLTA